VVEVYNEGNLIWIHGFHLLVLPSFISKNLPKAKTALFLHTPFPSSEIFRTLSVR
jgi:trehalose 6-phosphate synthase/phosphatase